MIEVVVKGLEEVIKEKIEKERGKDKEVVKVIEEMKRMVLQSHD